MTEKRKLPDSRPSEQTRQALIGAGLALFGEKGFDATSTREIAAAAEANIGSIAYHFGNKQGLRIACANHIVDTVAGVAGRALSRPGDLPQDPEAARAALASIIETMAAFLLTRQEADAFVQFLLREIAQPGKTVEIIYDGVFFPVHSRLCQLWEDATGEPAESEAARITVFTLIGQVIYFRIAKPIVLKRMGWSRFGAQEVAKIVAVAAASMHLLAADRAGETNPESDR